MGLIIFDFDGTIADTFEFVPNIVNTIAPEFGYRKFTEAEVEKLRDKPAREIIKEYKISIFKLPKILFRAREELAKDIPKIKAFPGIKEVINQLAADNNVAVVSSNSQENIDKFLAHNCIVVSAVITENSLFGKQKAIKKAIKRFGAKKEETIYIGDEVRDIEAAQKAGVRVISVSWGYNKKSVLANENQVIVDKPEELVKIIESLNRLLFETNKI